MCLDFNFVLQLISDPSQTSVPNQVRADHYFALLGQFTGVVKHHGKAEK